MKGLPPGIFLVLFLCAFASMLGIGIIAPILPFYAQKLGASGIWIGIIFSGYSLTRVAFLPIVGRISDRKERKVFIVWGLFLYAAVSLLYILARSVVDLSIIRMIHGASSAMILPVVQAYVGDLTPRGKEGLYINTFNVSAFLGMGFGPLLGGALTHAYGIASAFYALCGVSTLGMILAIWLIPVRSQIRGLIIPDKKRASFRQMLADNRILAICAYRASRALWRRGIIAFLPLYAVPYLHMSLAEIGVLLSVYLLFGGLIEGAIGWIADRVRKMPMILVGSFAAPFLMAFIPLVKYPFLLAVLLVAMAGLSSVSRVAVQALGLQIGRNYGMGSVMGLYSSAMSLGGIIGPLVFGIIMDLYGVKSVYFAGSLMGILGSFWMLYYFRSARHQVGFSPDTHT
ncbi:MAG: MFS transporter [Deltaproteobacteria bacterium]|nr:MFS transporter [Deltaproteobacteria bacterium]